MDTSREKIIVRTSIAGIIANVVLATFKALVGLATNSIAVTLDAVNNLSDALSSVITIIGTKLAGKAPDKEHPLGHGRAEYMSQTIVAVIVLYAGVASLVESVKKIISPVEADYTVVSLLILVVAIIVKLRLGDYVKRKGAEVHSGTLIASGADAFFDAVLSGSVLFSAVFYLLTGIGLEAYVGVVISAVIIKSGVEIVLDAVSEMLGVRAPAELTQGIKQTVLTEEGVRGVYDVLLHNYGPERYMASLHVEVDDCMTAREIDVLTRHLQEKVYEEHHVVLTTVGIYSSNTGDDEISEIRNAVTKVVMAHDGVLQMHGFYVDLERKDLRFDVILDFSLPNRKAVYEHICGDVREMFPDYRVSITLDIDASD